jgi:hypothetical protein
MPWGYLFISLDERLLSCAALRDFIDKCVNGALIDKSASMRHVTRLPTAIMTSLASDPMAAVRAGARDGN